MFKRFAFSLAVILCGVFALGSALSAHVAYASKGGGGGNQPTPTPTSGPVSPMAITTTSDDLGSGNVGTSYSNFITSTGGQGGPLRYSLVAGKLPDGLSMTNFGVQSALINGKPTRVQTANFTVKVQDTTGHSATKSFTMTINPAVPLAINEPNTTLTPGAVGQSYLKNLFGSGGTQPYKWSVVAGALPLGLVLSTNGSITGTPRTAGTFTFTLRLADSGGQQVSQQFSITIS